MKEKNMVNRINKALRINNLAGHMEKAMKKARNHIETAKKYEEQIQEIIN